VNFEIDAATVLAILVEKSQTQPLLAAWIEAAQWQAAAMATNPPSEDDDG
jgi:hypothetical protein